MSVNDDCCAAVDACGTLPGGFVRLRYFYGKRMSAQDFIDEQNYHTAKQRFHTQRLHGSGVLCGLAVTLEADSTRLRVSKGAAIDGCGREIVVGYDQCIDLGAWFVRELEARREVDNTWPGEGVLVNEDELPLVVLLRYRECRVAPEPAPRDPCACDTAGTDYGRVREEFELKVIPANELTALSTPSPFPSNAKLEQALGQRTAGATLAGALSAAVSAGCFAAETDEWLTLATLTATLDGDTPALSQVTALRRQATLLARTSLLQELLLRTLSAQMAPGSLNGGPEVVSLELEAQPAPASGYSLCLRLSGSVVEGTVPEEAFTLTQLTADGTGWTPIDCTTSYVDNPLRILVTPGTSDPSPFQTGGLYRLALDPTKVGAANPIVDADMRPLRPIHGSFQFSIASVDGTRQLVDLPYSAGADV